MTVWKQFLWVQRLNLIVLTRKIQKFLLLKWNYFSPLFLMWKFYLLKYFLCLFCLFCPVVLSLSLKGKTSWRLNSFENKILQVFTPCATFLLLLDITAPQRTFDEFKEIFTPWMKQSRMHQADTHMAPMFSYSISFGIISRNYFIQWKRDKINKNKPLEILTL